MTREQPRRATGLGGGERAVIDVALENQNNGQAVHVLINELRAYHYAQNQGLIAISVPEFLVVLLTRGILNIQETVDVFHRLDALRSTPKAFIEVAHTVIQAWGGSV